MFSDFHVHSDLSFDSNEPTVNQVKKAIELGMKKICFTEHVDLGWNYDNEKSSVDIDLYDTTIATLRKEYGDQIEILKGIEVGLTYDNIDDTKKYLEENEFDYVIASIHELDNDDPYPPKFWEGKDESIVIRRYFETTYDLIKDFSYADTLGHMDYITRYAPSKSYNPEDFQDIIDKILVALIESNICLEINTSNLAKGNEYTNPHPFILERYSALGGKNIVVGSDAHKSDVLGYAFDVADELVRKYSLTVLNK